MNGGLTPLFSVEMGGVFLVPVVKNHHPKGYGSPIKYERAVIKHIKKSFV